MTNEDTDKKNDPKNAKKEFDKAILLIRASYKFFASSLPQAKQFTPGRPLRFRTFVFASEGRANSMLVELGWAFLMRLDAAFEPFRLRLGIKNKKDIEGLLTESGFSSEEIKGLNIARDLRNIFQHGDGDATLLSKTPSYVQHTNGEEPQLYPKHIEQFIVLFEKAANVLGKEKDGEYLH